MRDSKVGAMSKDQINKDQEEPQLIESETVDEITPVPARRRKRRAKSSKQAADRAAAGTAEDTSDRDENETSSSRAPAGRRRTDDDEEELRIPDVLPILPLKDIVIYPFAVQPLGVGQERSIRLIDEVMRGNRLVALVAQKSADVVRRYRTGRSRRYLQGWHGCAHRAYDPHAGWPHPDYRAGTGTGRYR